MNTVKKLWRDWIGLWRVCGCCVALQWLLALVWNAPHVLRTRNLNSVDQWVGVGPYRIRHPTARMQFEVKGIGILSGVREMYVRDCYLRNGILEIRKDDVVVDLGANLGNFTNLALAHGRAVRAVAVEPSLALNASFEASVGENHGFRERVKLIRAFIGEPCEKHIAVINKDSNYSDAPWLSVNAFLDEAAITRIDFLKCDIEGGEFAALGPGSRLVEMAQALAVEIHAFAGDVDALVDSISTRGLIPVFRENHPDGTCVLLAKRG